ncbi:MAG: PKD domain-containing protein [Bacteroidota bacterium]
MKFYQFLSSFLIILSVSFQHAISQHSILGDIEACYDECKTYNLSGGVGGPYYWKSTGIFNGTNQGNQVEVCWNTIGSNTITLVDFSAPVLDQIQQINVTVAAIPKPEVILPKYPECVVRDSIITTPEQEFETVECATACSGSTAFYGIEERSGIIASWQVRGGTILSESPEGILVQWNLSGNGSIILSETNNFGCADSSFYCFEILDPLEVDVLAFNGGANSINVCAGQEVYLQATGSEETTSFEWDLGNGNYNYGTNITTSYNQGGTYEIMLIGSTECRCFDTSYYEIIVDPNPGPEITCTGTTCGNEDHTYFAANTCGSYMWNVSGNGTIVKGGGPGDDYITVNWSNGPVGTIGLSTIGCDDAVCSGETVVQIPILDGSASIDGPAVACKSGYSNYSVQYYNGTEYSWDVSGNGSIIQGWGTNQITIEWDDNPQESYSAVVSVSYENCFLECSGQASLNVDLKPDFEIGFPSVACAGEQIYINGVEGWNSATLSWTITSPSGVVSSFPNINYVHQPFSEIGIHTVVATDTNDNYCNDEISSFFEIIEPPSTPTSINGPLIICKNEYYNYSLPTTDPNVSVIWYIYDGTDFRFTRSATVSIQWTSNGPYRLRVLYSREDTYCRSDELEVLIEAAENATISGSAVTCVDHVENYSIGATNGTLPEWTIVPSDAGSIIYNTDNTIDVMWHLSGTHQIITDYCGSVLSYPVDVNPLGLNMVTYVDEICPGETTPIVSNISPGSTVEIKDQSDVVIGTSTNEMVSSGRYEVVITSIHGCKEVFPVVIDTFLPPVIRVSSPDENAFCLPHPNVSIEALNTNDGYTFEWFHNNIAMGITTSSISTNQYGDYHVLVTDANGCTALSNTHTLHEWCDGDPPPGTCTGSGHGPVSIQELVLSCNGKSLTVAGLGYSSTTFAWNFGDPDSEPNNTAIGFSVVHEFTYAGHYYVSVSGNVPGENGVDIFTVPAAPLFDYDRECVGNPIQFRNHSTFIPGHNIINYRWNFDDPASGSNNTSNDENPTHQYNSPGTYNVTLEIESTNGCTSAYQLEVIVDDGPLADFIFPPSACTDAGIMFEAIQDEKIYTYEWDFDDPSSGIANISNSPIAIHTFSGTGSYDVTLTVTDGNNCIQSITKTVDVTTTSLSGDIASNRTFPICYGEEVTLTAPSGGNAYVWSDGSTGQSITVNKSGLYYVTITENTGCDYMPDPINVIIEGFLDTRIRAALIEDQYSGPSYFDSIEICQGQLITLQTNWINGATYLWSSGQTNSFINENELSSLSIGRHEYNVTVTDPISGCAIESEPMIIVVTPLPNAVQISAPSSILCEGEEHLLSVDNPEPDLIYYWSNGDIGLSTTVTKSGYYTATAKNRKGCERESGGIYIAPLPNANRINLGCTEACFPETICIPNIPGAASYQWLLDGSPIPGPAGTTKDLVAEQAGDYQLVVENFNGCRDTSDLLSIDAEPSNQSISGIVFIDDNKNGVWDAGEELLENVPINLYSGSVFEATILTDLAGFYNFDPVDISNPRIEIDTTGLGLNIAGGLLEEDINFTDCSEDREKNFPLIQECISNSVNMSMFTCPGETIIVSNIVLQEGDTWSFDDLNMSGCDSTTFVTVYAFPESVVDIATTESCKDVENGVLDITIMAGTGLQFSVDNTSSYSTSLQFDNLAPGMHTLWITDDNGCTNSYPFEIETIEAPIMFINAQNTCENDSTGSVAIVPHGFGNYQFSMDGVTFSSTAEFDNLPVGTHVLYVQGDNSCVHEYSFTVAVNPEPLFDLMSSASCNTGASGSLAIMPLNAGTFEYSLDNITFSTTPNFDNLPGGWHTLYVEELNGCIHSYPFEIPENETPLIDLAVTNTCEGDNQGTVIITPVTTGNYEYSLDGSTYSSDLEFNNLSQGNHMVYVLEDGVCEFQFPAFIDVPAAPLFTILTEDACTGEANGSAIMESSETGLQFSLDQINYTEENLIPNLEAGLHTIYVLGENSCIHPIEVEIFEAGELEIEFTDPILDCSIQEVNLAPNIIASEGKLFYEWSSGETDSLITTRNTGEYSVSITDKCSTSEFTWNIEFEEVSKEQPIFLPNIFSPNQDGVNECFAPVIRPETTILNYRMIIFDRWGNKFFETTDINDCWDGIFNGKNVRTGVFVYVLDLEYTYCVEVENLQKQGDVTVVH